MRTFLRSYRGTHPLGRSALSLLRCGEHPRGYPDVASGRCTGTLRLWGRERLAERLPRHPTGKRDCTRTVPQRGKAVSSVVTSGCPKRSEGGCPCRNEDDNRLSKRNHAGQEITKEAPPPTRGDSASFVRAGLAEELSLPHRTRQGSAHARGQHQPDRG